ncbi:YdhK family protein [Planococcus ruber]|uniref:YdhK family protein n=1 Tax=Planococcus ruber TaxID=2027871 RepID=UPI001FEFE916|nr:YdhK family protein [Planococcus ruber]MCJ1907658.1 YdhK family protein [Planococcus ruber]
MKLNRILTFCLAGALAIILAACSSESSDQESMEHGENGHMEHSSTGELPEDLKKAQNPKYDEGSSVLMNADHMEGMQGTEATVSGAFDTIAYSISYTPENGGDRVENHKWIVQKEIENAGEEAFQPGDAVIVEASHMEGMQGAEAIIESVEKTTVYMVDFTPASGDETVKNHKWVVEKELSAE